MSQEDLDFTRRFIDHYNETGEFHWDAVDRDTVWVIDPAAWLGGTSGVEELIEVGYLRREDAPGAVGLRG
jgi:hypothetical protein